MYKIIACDLDETLLNADTHVSEVNRKAIQKLLLLESNLYQQRVEVIFLCKIR